MATTTRTVSNDAGSSDEGVAGLKQRGWSHYIDDSFLPTWTYDGLCCNHCTGWCEFLPSYLELRPSSGLGRRGAATGSSARSSPASDNGSLLAIRFCRGCVQKGIEDRCSASGYWKYDAPRAAWRAVDAALAGSTDASMCPHQQPLFCNDSALPPLTTDPEQLSHHVARVVPDLYPWTVARFGAHQAPLNVARRGFSLHAPDADRIWYSRTDIVCPCSGETTPAIVAFSGIRHGSLVIDTCQACLQASAPSSHRPRSGQQQCKLRGRHVRPDGRLVDQLGSTIGDPVSRGTLRSLSMYPLKDTDTTRAALLKTSTHGTSRSIDSLQQLVTHGFYRILSDGLASSHLRPVASLRSLSLPTIRTRRFGYKIDGTCFRSVYNDPTAAVPQMCTSLPVLVTELFRSSDHTAILPRLRTSRLDQKHLLDRCIDGTLYAGHFMPVELLAAEQGAWATLGSRRSSCLVADISGSLFCHWPSEWADRHQSITPTISSPPSNDLITSILTAGTILPWRMQLGHRGAVFLHAFGAPLIFYIARHPAGLASLRAAISDNGAADHPLSSCENWLQHGDVVAGPSALGPTAVERVVLHPGQALVVEASTAVQVLGLGLAAFERRVMISDQWRSNVAPHATTCEHDPELEEWHYLAEYTDRALDVTMQGHFDQWWPQDTAPRI